MSSFVKKLKNIISGTDFLLLIFCAAASAYGIISVHSATLCKTAEGAVMSRDTKTMILAVALGLLAAVAISFIDCNFIAKMSPLIGTVCVLLIVLLFFAGVGRAERQDAKIWLELGPTGLFFQPSELVKIGFVITFGVHIDLVRDRLSHFFPLLLLCLHAAVPTGLVILSGDLGSALVFMIMFIAMMFCAGVQLRFFAMGIAAVGAAVPVIWNFILGNTQKERFLSLLFPERYTDIIYQQERGIEAIASGGLSGQGLFGGKYTQGGIVPEQENDMIFSAFAEELGLIGCALAFILFLAVIFRIIKIGIKSKNDAYAVMCFGISAMIAAQIVINVGMCLKLLPVIGITLPFFSAGGSSNLCLYIGIGLVMSIYRRNAESEITAIRLHSKTVFANQ